MSESINALTVPLLIVSSAVGAIEWSHDRDVLGSILATPIIIFFIKLAALIN